MSNKKVIIIGGGLGGLMTGALLSKEGYKVSVFEKHHNIGGGLQSYKRFGTTFDTGMHVFGGMRKGGNIRRICEYLGIMDDFKYLDIDDSPCISLFVASEKTSYDINVGTNGFIETLSSYFPKEKENLAKYVSKLYRIMDELDLFYLRQNTHDIFEHSEEYNISVNDLLNRCIDDNKLKSVIACINTLYAGEKGISPFYLHAAISMIFLNGACRVVGGYSNFASALVNVIRKNNGEIKTNSEVKQIRIAEGKFCSIVLANDEEILGDYCVSAIPPTVMLDMVEEEHVFSNAYRKSLDSRNDSLSAFVVNIKLKEQRLKFFNQIRFYYSDYNSAWEASDGKTIDKFMYMTPPDENQNEWATTLSVTALMKWDAVTEWENTKSGHRGEDYNSWKRMLCKDIVEKLNNVIPDFWDMIEYVDAASPLTIRDNTSVRHGAMCGNRNECGNLFNSFLPTKTKVENLLLTGQSNNMHGFCGVSLTAVQTAEGILGNNYLIDRL